jgi:outer membrane autotransporter protein
MDVTRTPYAAVARAENQQAAAVALDRGLIVASGDALNVFNALDSFTSAPAATNAFQQLGGQIHTVFQTTGVENAQHFSGAVRQHLRNDQTRSGGKGAAISAAVEDGSRYISNQLAMVSSGERIEPVQVALGDVDPELGRARGSAWMRGFGLLGSADGKASRASNDIGYRIAGVAGGADYGVTRDFTVGAALGYANTQADLLGGNADTGRADTVSGALYGGWESGPLYVDGTLGYARDDYRTRRRLIFAGIDRQAEGKYKGREVFLDAETGYRLRLDGFRIVPSLGLAYTNSQQDDFTEAGANSLNLVVDSRSIDSIRASVGGHVSYELAMDDGLVLVPEARLRYQREFGDQERVIDARFAGINGGTFTTRGAEPGRDAALLGLSFTAKLDPGLALFVDYDADLHSNASVHAVAGGLRFTW